MKFDFLTYLFEIINFFILLWILKKILYNPVISTLKKRKEYIKNRIEEAERAEEQVEKLKNEYQNLIKEMENIKKNKLAEINKEVQEEKNRLFHEMKKELEAERKRYIESLELEKREILKEIKEDIINNSLLFVSKILKDLSDRYLHKKLINLALSSLEKLKEAEIKQIKEDLKKRNTVLLETPYPLSDEEKLLIQEKIKELFNIDVNFQIKENKDLTAGIRIHLGSKMIDSSISGQLQIYENILREKIEAV
ncbi:F0F1 ATP synthase subunit delta [Persephonella sp.]